MSKGAKLEEDLAGLVAAVDAFQSPLVNAYALDIVFEEVMEKDLLVYAQLPSNLHSIQAPAIGRVMLADVKHESALRQVLGNERNQTLFPVSIDEFGTFADFAIVDCLSKARDAFVAYTLSHQSQADIPDERLARGIWDNTRTKDLCTRTTPTSASASRAPWARVHTSSTRCSRRQTSSGGRRRRAPCPRARWRSTSSTPTPSRRCAPAARATWPSRARQADSRCRWPTASCRRWVRSDAPPSAAEPDATVAPPGQPGRHIGLVIANPPGDADGANTEKGETKALETRGLTRMKKKVSNG